MVFPARSRLPVVINNAVGSVEYFMSRPAGAETEIDVFKTIFKSGIEAAEFEKDFLLHEPAGSGHTLEFLTEQRRAEVRRLPPVKMDRALPGIKDHPGVIDEFGSGSQVPVSDDSNGRVTAGSRKKLLQPAGSHQRVIIEKAKVFPPGERSRAVDVLSKTFPRVIRDRSDPGAEGLQILSRSIRRVIINDDDFKRSGFLSRLKHAFEAGFGKIQAVMDRDQDGTGGPIVFRRWPFGIAVRCLSVAFFETQHTGAEFMPGNMISWQNSPEQGV